MLICSVCAVLEDGGKTAGRALDAAEKFEKENDLPDAKKEYEFVIQLLRARNRCPSCIDAVVKAREALR